MVKLMIMNSVTDISMCWLISFADGRKIGFTNFDQILTINDIEYHPTSGKFTNITSYAFNSTSKPSGIFSILSDIPEDIFSEPLQFTSVEVILLKRSTKESVSLFCGTVSGIHSANGVINIEISSLLSQLDKIITKKYSKTCRAKLYDNQCMLTKNQFKIDVEISGLLDQDSSFSINTTIDNKKYYEDGFVLFHTGKNNKLEYRIDLIDDRIIFLKTSLLCQVSIGDKISLYPGCDKTFHTCFKKFNNTINFRGEPHAPSGQDIIG